MFANWGCILSEEKISQMLGEHYSRAFALHGQKPEGVDWGPEPDDHKIRLDRMLAVTELGTPKVRTTLLDVGCGFGSLLDLIHERDMAVDYHGIDLCVSMIKAAQSKYPDAQWLVGDILKTDIPEKYDYVVCNGILTQKLGASISEMDEFAKALISKMFKLCEIGIAFNLMTTHVNFMVPNLFYRNPVELLGWCMTELTPRVRLDHAYPLFEYTLYLYREDAPGLVYGSHRRSKAE